MKLFTDLPESKNMISTIKNKKFGLDDITIRMIGNLLDETFSILVQLINKSFQNMS